MKICICTNTRPHPTGVNTHVNALAKYLNLSGNQTLIVTPFGVSQQIKIKAGLVKKVDQLTSNRGFITFILLLASQLLTFINLIRAHLKNKYEVVIAQDPLSVNMAGILKKIFKLTIIINIHDTLEKSLLRQRKISQGDFTHRYVCHLERKAMKISAGIFGDSKYVLDFVKSQGIIPEDKPLALINPSADSQIFFFEPSTRQTIREKLKIKPDQFVILFTGHLSDIKGAIYPVYALNEINKVDPNFLLFYAGDGPERQNILDLAQKFNLQTKINLLGKIPPENLREMYNAADVAVIPSITVQGKQDTHPVVAAEAMICKLPVVASASGGLMEIISNQQNGLLFPEKDYKKMAQAILKLKSDPVFRKKIIDNAYFHSQDYLPGKMAQKVLNFIETVKSKH